jgi:hypothetical protein
MADHTIEVTFKATASCSTPDMGRDEWVIRRMAQAICIPGTPMETVPIQAINEAARTYLMINAMRVALEEEVAAATKLEKVN